MTIPHLIDLDQKLPGQRRFISCWAVPAGDTSYIVDPGPASTGGFLVEKLGVLGFARLDYVLLTHIHLDHGGAASAVLAAYPGARVVCMDSVASHLIEPARLWAGSLKVLGPVAAAYGEPAPVPADRIAPVAELKGRGFTVVPTPGHAAHHQCYVRDGILFVGEAAGTRYPLPDNRLYLRPATPPRFRLETALTSIDRLLALDPLPDRLAMAHYGMVEGRTAEVLQAARDQLEIWVSAIREQSAIGRGADLDRRIHERLLKVDPWYAPFSDLPADIQTRELSFSSQSIRGMLEYVDSGDI